MPRWSRFFGAAVLLSSACNKDPLPAGFQAVELGMSLEALTAARPKAAPDPEDPARVIDPSGPATFRFAEGKLVGLRIQMPHDDELLRSYEARFGGRSGERARYTYDVGGHPLRLYATATGIDLVYGLDPGSAGGAAVIATGVAAPSEPSIDVPRTGKRAEPPAAKNLQVSGVDIWLLPLSTSAEASAAVRFILWTGSTDDPPEAPGATASITALVLDRVIEGADASLVKVEAATFRTHLFFTITGVTPEVIRVSQAVGRALRAVGLNRPSAGDVARAHASIARYAKTARLVPELLADETFAAVFPASAFVASPVEAERPVPPLEAVVARTKAFGRSPLSIVCTGDVDESTAQELAAAAGERPRDTKAKLKKPQLPGAGHVDMRDVSVVAEGVWIGAVDSAEQWAGILLAKSWLEAHARAELRTRAAPIEVIASGPSGAARLILIAATRERADDEIAAAVKETLHRARTAPLGLELERVRDRSFNSVVRGLSTPEDGVELLTELALLRAGPEWPAEILAAIDRMTDQRLEEILRTMIQPSQSFTMRWGPVKP